jgi:hypothetical protein
VLDQIHEAQVNILTNNNVSARILYDCPEIKILMNLCIQYSKTLSQMSEKEYMCGKYQIDSVRRNQYKYLLGVVSTWFQEARNYYYKMTKNEIPFVTVAHDIWDSDNHEKLGVTIFFIIPSNRIMFEFQLGWSTSTARRPTMLLP